MIALQDQTYYVTGLPKYSQIISPQGIHTSEGYNGAFVPYFYDDNDSYTELNFKWDKP